MMPVRTAEWLGTRAARLRSGQTLDVEAGEYRGTLTIRTPVTLRAVGGPVRIRSTTGPAVRVIGCAVTLVGLTIDGEYGDAVIVETPPIGRSGESDVWLTLEDCAVAGQASGVSVATAHVRLRVRGGSIRGGRGAAIALPERGVADLADVEVTSASGAGIAGGSGARIGLAEVRIQRCGRAGIWLGDRSELWADSGGSLTVRDCGGSGIVLGKRSTGAIRSATIADNGAWGIVAPGSEVSVQGVTFSGNALGVRSDGPGTAQGGKA